MSRPARFTLTAAFACAGRGVVLMTRGRNGRIQIAFAILVVALGAIFHLTAGEWALVAVSIALVLAFETINSAVERVVDLVSPDYDDLARDAKDLAAGAVLIATLGSVAIGLIIFLPHFIAVARRWG